jgi:apolipoprotein D and lipocalin family protein
MHLKTKLLCFTLCFAVLLNGCAGKSGNKSVPEPKKSVDITQYFGRWYEIARYDNWFEDGCESPKADYKWLDKSEGIVSVTNSCMQDGELDIAEGRAKIVEGSNNAKLKISFFGPFYLGDYWVLDHADDYSWSIVGEPSGSYLWLLARTPKLEPELQTMLINKIAELGYDTNMLIYPQQTEEK